MVVPGRQAVLSWQQPVWGTRSRRRCSCPPRSGVPTSRPDRRRTGRCRWRSTRRRSWNRTRRTCRRRGRTPRRGGHAGAARTAGGYPFRRSPSPIFPPTWPWRSVALRDPVWQLAPPRRKFSSVIQGRFRFWFWWWRHCGSSTLPDRTPGFSQYFRSPPPYSSERQYR